MAEISAERAALIARDQMNKTTQTMAIANAKSYGLQRADGFISQENTQAEIPTLILTANCSISTLDYMIRMWVTT